MNWRRGMLRLWVAANAIWVLLVIGVTFGPAMFAVPSSALNWSSTTASIPKSSAGKLSANPDTGEVLYLDKSANESKPASEKVNPQTREIIAFDGEDWQVVNVQGPGISRRIDNALRENSDHETQLRMSFLKNELLSLSFWTLLLGPPAVAGIFLLMIVWVVAGFRLRQS